MKDSDVTWSKAQVRRSLTQSKTWRAKHPRLFEGQGPREKKMTDSFFSTLKNAHCQKLTSKKVFVYFYLLFFVGNISFQTSYEPHSSFESENI